MQANNFHELTESNFKPILESSFELPVLLYFWSPAMEDSVSFIEQLRQLHAHQANSFSVALIDCQAQQTIAMQFGIQNVPTTAVFKNGQPVDGLAGVQPIDAIEKMLAPHLPSIEELTLNAANEKLAAGEFAAALSLFNQLPTEQQHKGDVKLAMAHCCVELAQFTNAKALLDTVPLEYKEGEYKQLLALIELQEQAANSPEIQQLEHSFKQDPSNLDIIAELAINYQQVNRSEEALAILWGVLSKDLNAKDGELKKHFMDILSALGQGNPMASTYRRLLYSALH